jgi:chromosome segregation ATPase
VNPNKNIEDEYIHNLQQQMHFMELEIKLLKEKVIEDDEASGIGSLFNDEKYSEMRSEYLKRIEDIDKERIRISEESFKLDAQINILTDQNNKMIEIRDNMHATLKQKEKDLEAKLKELLRQRRDLEKEIKDLKRNLDTQNKNNFDYNIQLKNEAADDEHGTYRHERDLTQAEERHKQKEEELAKINGELDDIQKQFEANPEYQANEEQINKNLEDARNMYVEMHILKRQVEEMKQATELYKKAVEEEKDRKRKLIEKNKDLKKESEAKEQTERMRMQKLMNDTKDPDLREYMIANQKVNESVNDLDTGLENEKNKYDDLQAEKIDLERKHDDMVKTIEKLKTSKEAHDTQLPELKTATKDLEAEVNELEKQQTDEGQVNKDVEDKYRKLA